MKDIYIPDPLWGSNLASIILDLEKLRTKRLSSDVPPHIFFELKNIFHILETLGSARIEGNNTTLAEYVEKIIVDRDVADEPRIEIDNLENAIVFIEKNVNVDRQIDRAFLSQIHRIITKDLTPPPKGEGTYYAGQLRKHNVSIKRSNHTPPAAVVLQDYFESFLEFINFPHKEQYQLLMVAIAHHRFEYIHPFDNGNGRMGRLLNYAFLIKLGFRVDCGRLINPSSLFYADRDRYYEMLSMADSLRDEDILAWCEYFLSGLKNEIEKIDSLLEIEFVRSQILHPVIKRAFEREHITQLESKILSYLVDKEDLTIKSEELSRFGIESSKEKTKVINALREKKILFPTKQNGRIYSLRFSNNYLLRIVIDVLEKLGFVSKFLNG